MTRPEPCDAAKPAADTTLVQTEQQWQRSPECPAGQPRRVGLARWARSGLAEPLEMRSDHVDDSHFITYSLRQSRLCFSIARRTVIPSLMPAKGLLLQGPTWQMRHSIYHEDFDGFRIYLPQTLLAEAYESLHGRSATEPLNLFAPHLAEDPILIGLVRSLYTVGLAGGPLGPTFADGVGLAAAIRLVSRYARPLSSPRLVDGAAAARQQLQRALDYIEAHLHQPIYLEQLACAAGMSRARLTATFRQYIGETPCRQVLRRRVAAAQRLLQDRSLSVEQVAQQVGLSSRAHFTRAFHKIVGTTPLRWRAARCEG